jgi:hypothetical protein
MSRRASLPGAAELFRTTGSSSTSAATEEPPTPAAQHPGVGAVPAPISELEDVPDETLASVPSTRAKQPSTRQVRSTRRVRAVGDRTPSGRERHEEKITVYCSPEELLDLERARLHLRAEHGMAVDRGRIVREAVAVVLADLEAKGESSILVRRLRES